MPQKVFIEIDKRQAEWVVVAYLAQDLRMIEVHEKGKDPHATTGSLISGLPEDFVKMEHKAVGHLTDPAEIDRIRRNHPEISPIYSRPSGYFFPRIFSIRQGGKKSNHGLNYDMGYRRFALENEMEEMEAKRIVSAYFDGYPGIRTNFHSFVQRRLREDRTLTNCFGRPRRFYNAIGDELFKEAYSFIPQSTVGDIVNRAIISIYNDDAPFLRLLEILANVHDSALFQYPITGSNWTDAVAAIRRCYEYLTPELEYFGRKFTIHSDIKIGLNWGEYQKSTPENPGNELGMREFPTDWSPSDLRFKLQESWERLCAPTRSAAR